MPPSTDASRSEKFRYEYGAGPLHLIAVIASLALALYAILRIIQIPSTGGILLWMGAAIVAHDFIALPLYSLFLRVAEEGVDASVRTRRRGLLVLNHIRIPAAFSAVLLLISFPLIFQLDEPRYKLTTGLDLDRYLGNWLLITGVLFAISGLWLALKLRSRAADRPMVGVRAKAAATPQGPPPAPPRGLVWGARATLAVGALLSLFVIALAIYGVINSFPI
jgi:hypothetical protein